MPTFIGLSRSLLLREGRFVRGSNPELQRQKRWHVSRYTNEALLCPVEESNLRTMTHNHVCCQLHQPSERAGPRRESNPDWSRMLCRGLGTTTTAGFEPTREDPIQLATVRLKTSRPCRLYSIDQWAKDPFLNSVDVSTTRYYGLRTGSPKWSIAG